MLKKSRLFATLPVVAASTLALAASENSKPNIIVIMGDDIGYGDFSCYGATKVSTPHIDKLANEGIKFTSGYATHATCTPTRYSFITGEYAWRKPGTGILKGDANMIISTERPTVASLVKQGGYKTGIVGKWHLGLGKGKIDWNKEIKPTPVELGFDRYFGMAATNDRVPSVYISQHHVADLDPNDPIQVSYRGKIGKEPTGRENPELLTMKPRTLKDHHAGTIVNGISRIGYMSGGRKARWDDETMTFRYLEEANKFIDQNKKSPFFLYFALHQAHVPKVVSKKFAGTSKAGLRGDLIQEFDWTVGEIVKNLKKNGILENTIVLISSDNGGVALDGYQDNGWKDTQESGHAFNGPLSGTKYSGNEGGVRMPFVVSWPKMIKTGKVSDEVVSLVDISATAASLAGVDLPKNAAPDSYDLSELFAGKTDKSPRPFHITTGIGNQIAIRKGAWKLFPSSKNRNGKVKPARLYNLNKDIAERKNLADKNPDKVNELTVLFNKAKEDGFTRPNGAKVAIR